MRRFGPQRRFGDRLGVVVVVLLSLHERLHIDRRDDPRLVAELAQGAADEMGAEAGLHADDAWRQLLERLGERQPLDLAAERDLAVSAEADEVEDFLADIDADRGKGCNGGIHGLLLRLMRSSLGPRRRGSSRSIPLADVCDPAFECSCGSTSGRLLQSVKVCHAGPSRRPPSIRREATRASYPVCWDDLSQTGAYGSR